MITRQNEHRKVIIEVNEIVEYIYIYIYIYPERTTSDL